MTSTGILSYLTTPKIDQDALKQGNELIKMGSEANDRTLILHGIRYLLQSLRELSPEEVESIFPGQIKSDSNIREIVEISTSIAISCSKKALPLVIYAGDRVGTVGKVVMDTPPGKFIADFCSSVILGALRGAKRGLA